ncbi:MAG TPA: discoidin domain-containing protein [Phycisphaerae bacterium]|nr:discoidin domain-containing protein [Phycisphaerae bacterium]
MSSLDGRNQTLQALYQLSSSDFHDITSGYNGSYAGAGYDLVTGRGTPVANSVASDVLAGTVITSGYYNNSPTYAPQNAFDGNPSTFYASSTSSGGYVGIDLGASKRAALTSVSFMGRSGYEWEMATGVFQGSNDGTTWDTLANASTPSSGQYTTVKSSSTTTYRYFRYYNGTYNADVAELEFIGTVSTVFTGSVVTSGAWSGDPTYAAANAFDGSRSTYFASSNASGGFVGIDLGASTCGVLTAVSFVGRPGVESRMVGGVIYGTNDFSHWDTLATITSAPASGQYETLTISSTTPYRYFVYGNPSNYADVAELQFIGTTTSILSGSVITSGAYSGDPTYAASNAFDGNPATFFASAASSGGFVGIDLGANNRATLSSVSYLGRSGFESRMSGGIIYGSNDYNHWDTIATITAPSAGVYSTVNISSTTAYRYIVYGNPNNYADVADLKFSGTLSTVLSGTSFSSTPWQNNSAYGAPYAFDGNTSTYFASNDAANGYVGLDLGASQRAILSSVAFVGRSGAESRMAGGLFQGSNDGSTWTTLGAVISPPASGQYGTVSITSSTPYRYFRYYNPSNYADVAELQFIGKVMNVLSGTAITSGYVSGYPATNAFDGNASTFYAASSTNSYVGLDLGASGAAPLTAATLIARSGYEYRLVSGVIQGSNDNTNWNTLASVGFTPASGESSTIQIASTTSYRYYRYYNPTEYADLAELQLLS